jgi:glutathione S-transferase
MLELFYVPAGSASCRVRFCLAEKELSYEAKTVNIREGEQHSEAYLRLNPNGLVPTLVHDGKPVWESAVICEYLDDAFPNPPLKPSDPHLRSLMRNWVKYFDEQCQPALIVFNWSIRVAPYASRWTDEELKERLARIPTAARREAWLRAARNPYTEEERAAALKTLVGLIDRMERDLNKHAWLAGEAMSLADLAAAPFVWRLRTIAPDEFARPDLKTLNSWWERVAARPGFAVAFDQEFTAHRT